MPFDVMAETYDHDFSFSQIGKLQREAVWTRLLPLLNSYKRPLRILEINCGTGVDALRLATLGHYVTATDASAVMIQEAGKKITFEVKDNLHFLQLSFSERSGYSFAQPFDIVFSNFGGLNCIDEKALQQLNNDLAKITNPNAALFFVVMGKFCLWETAWHLLTIKPATAFRRLKGQASFAVNGNSMPIYYYSPHSFSKLFNNYYHCYNHAVGLFVPPSYLESFFLKHPSTLSYLDKLEKRFSNREWMSHFADHYCIVLKRNKS